MNRSFWVPTLPRVNSIRVLVNGLWKLFIDRNVIIFQVFIVTHHLVNLVLLLHFNLLLDVKTTVEISRSIASYLFVPFVVNLIDWFYMLTYPYLRCYLWMLNKLLSLVALRDDHFTLGLWVVSWINLVLVQDVLIVHLKVELVVHFGWLYQNLENKL